MSSKEKVPNALISEKDLGPPNLIKNFKEGRRGRDALDMEGEEFFRELSADIKDLETADNFIQNLLRNKFLNLDEKVSSAKEKLNERMVELEETLESLKGFFRDPKIEHSDIDEEFDELTIKEKENIETELENLETTYRVLGYFIRAGIISESDAFIRATEAIFRQIKNFSYPSE